METASLSIYELAAWAYEKQRNRFLSLLSQDEWEDWRGDFLIYVQKMSQVEAFHTNFLNQPGFAHTVASRFIIGCWRKRMALHEVPLFILDLTTGEYAPREIEDESASLNQNLERDAFWKYAATLLPPRKQKYAEILRLHCEGITYQELGGLYGITADSACKIVLRTVKTLWENLAKRGIDRAKFLEEAPVPTAPPRTFVYLYPAEDFKKSKD